MGEEKPESEGAALDSFLAGLDGGGAVGEIAGWRSGFAALDAALNGISPGLYLLIGPPASGKTAFARQLLDQVARLNAVPALFFAFAEKKADLRIRTLARLSGLETREIRRGAGWLLHTYGVSKQHVGEAEMAPGWGKLKLAAAEAKSWLDRVYLHECGRETTRDEIEGQIRAARETSERAQFPMVVIDDGQRLGGEALPFDARLPLVVEKLHGLALRLDAPVLAAWPEFEPAAAPEKWAERVAEADAVMVLREDIQRTKQLAGKRAVVLHIVKNRGGEKAVVRLDFSPGLAKFDEAR
ncbi:MAG TPA: DnaB-like helicase C-terminal domain-containing protein [Candidatus Binatia bacterium]